MEEDCFPHQTSIDEDNVEGGGASPTWASPGPRPSSPYPLQGAPPVAVPRTEPLPAGAAQDDLGGKTRRVSAEERQQKGQMAVANLRAMFKKD